MTINLELAIRLLRILTPLAASLALVTVAIGLVTAHWLFSEEKMINPKFNRTGDPELEFLSKFTVSGLWTLCYTNPGETDRHCIYINYFPTEEYSPDPNDSTLTIPYAVLRSAPFFFMATGLLVIAEVACFLGHFAPRRRYCTFLSGVSFIISGLLLLLGLVVYVSVFTAEIGSKLRPSSQLQPALFTYSYGYSFQLMVTGFLAAEVAGTSAIFLFIYWHRNRIAKKEMHRKMALALVQSPVDLSQAAHAHLQQHPLVMPPSSPVPSNRRPDSFSQLDRHLFPHREQLTYQCNGFVKIPCSCSSAAGGGGGTGAHITTDDESEIPTPPPAAHFPPRHLRQQQQNRECPVHPSYVTVHNTASGPPSARFPPTSRHLKQRDGMPDITAFSRMLVNQRRQMSTDSDNSTYKVTPSAAPVTGSNKRLVKQDSFSSTRVQCYQCHGAGHVNVPTPVPTLSANSNHHSHHHPQVSYARSLPRDLTSSTMIDLDSPEDESLYQHHFHIEHYQPVTHHQQNSRLVDEAHHHQHRLFNQRRHSIGPEPNQEHYGSLRRITAV